MKAIETKDQALLMEFVGYLMCIEAGWNINYSHHGLFFNLVCSMVQVAVTVPANIAMSYLLIH